MEYRSQGRQVSACLAVAASVAALASPAFGDMAPTGTVTARPATRQPANPAQVRAPAPPSNVAVNRPTVSMRAYRAYKARASRKRATASQPAAARAHTVPSASKTLKAPLASGFQGVNQAGSDGRAPSGANGAVGGDYNVLTTNDRYIVYDKAIPTTVLKDVNLNTFFGYATKPMFDPRVVYDPTWDRFVTSADAFEESGTNQILALSVSKSGDPTGPTWNYLINGKQICGSGVFVDYPQISTTQDAVIVTVNCFRDSDGVFLGSRAIAVAKSILYNGTGFSVPVFSPGDATATPPNVLDGNPRAHLLLAGGGTAVRDVTFTDPQSGFYATMAAPANITGFQTVTMPPDARQSGCSVTSCQIDTGDGRFVSPSTQINDSLWNVATLGFAGGTSFASPYWGEFDVEGAGADTTKQFGVRFLSSSSDDYNASLVAGADGRMFMTWSSSSPTTFISEAVAARKSTDAAGTLPALLVPFTSSSTLTGDFNANVGSQLWGNTSQITRGSTSTAWAWNGTSHGGSWGTFTTRFSNP
jgi:hypothetical protein